MKYEITPEIIESLKQSTDKKLYKRKIAGQDYIFTFISKEEYDLLYSWISDPNSKATESQINDRVVTMGLIYPQMSPQEWNELPGGVMGTLSRLIQEVSAIIPSEEDYLPLEIISVNNEIPEQFISEDELTALKMQYKSLTKIRFDDKIDIIVKPLNRMEHRAIEKLPEDQREYEVCKKCVVYPRVLNLDNQPAGYERTVFNVILNISGFLPESAVTEEL